MDDLVNVSPDEIRRLREARAWSQQHLADAAGLSLRTVQRVERDGSASAETRLAIAAALQVAVQSLTAPPSESVSAAAGVAGTEWGLLVFAAAAAGLMLVLWLGHGLPPQVASHFDVRGEPDGWMRAGTLAAAMVGLVVLVPSAVWGLAVFAVRSGRLNLVRAAHWLSPQQRPGTQRFLLRHVAVLAAAVVALLCFAFDLVVAANRGAAASTSLPFGNFLGGFGVFLVFAWVWMALLMRRFR